MAPTIQVLRAAKARLLAHNPDARVLKDSDGYRFESGRWGRRGPSVGPTPRAMECWLYAGDQILGALDSDGLADEDPVTGEFTPYVLADV